jgi:Mg2+ and Co2+ transporter CorA
MIEKHSDKLKNISSTNSDALTTRGPEDSKKSELMEDFDLDLDMNDKKDQEQKTDSNTTTSNSDTTTNRTNSSPLTNILPLVSTVMTMMNTNSPQSSFNQQIDHMESPVIEDVTELPSDKNMLLDEIQEELKDLDSSISEQRENSSISEHKST